MSSRFRQYLLEVYESRRDDPPSRRSKFPIQIDDQDDSDPLNEFCNIFCIVGSHNNFRIELSGNFPITREITDLVEIYNGIIDSSNSRLSLQLNIEQVGVLTDLADKIRKTAFIGDSINNPSWHRMSARTISSLYRFIRIIKEFKNTK